MYCIYKVTNKINNKVYIGKTKDFERRKKEHLAHKTNHLFSRALHKYGEDSFLWEIIEADINTVEEASDREKFWIKKYRSYFRWDGANGYNMTPGGDGGSCWNVRKVASYSLSGHFLMAFDTVSDCAEYYNIFETTSISVVCNDNHRSCKGMMFRYFDDTPEVKIEPYKFDNHRKVPICKLNKDGHLIKRYDGIVDAEKDGHRHSGIVACILGRYKTSDGYVWCYEKDLCSYIGIKAKPISRIHVRQYSLDNNFIASFESCAEAERQNGLPKGSYKKIHRALSSKSHISHGFRWLPA